MAKPLLHPFRIWYDGLDASEHYMDIEPLGESLRGVGQILRASTHFAFQHEYNKRKDKSYVRILVQPPRPGTWWCDAVAVAATQYPLLLPLSQKILWETSIATARAILFRRSGRRDLTDSTMAMVAKCIDNQVGALDTVAGLAKEVVGLAKEQGERDLIANQRLMDIAERLIDNTQPAAKNAVKPIGISCNRMRLGEGQDEPTIDEPMADAIRSTEDLEVMDEKEYLIRLDGVTLHTRSCKFEIAGQEGRYVNGKITDPAILQPDNQYTQSLNNHSEIRVRAKATMKGDNLHLFYISNTVAA